MVASEVRTLVQRSGDAAKTIKSLIGKSTEHVAAGDRLVADTDRALSEILQEVRNVTSKVEEISEASTEQTTGVEEVSATVSQMDEITQQNASLADRSAAAARSLSDQSQTLVDLVGYFKISQAAKASSVAGSNTAVAAWDSDREVNKSAPQSAPATAATNGTWAEF